MNEQTIQLIVILAFLAFVSVSLGAASFIRLVGLILDNGSKVEALVQALLHLLTLSSPEQAARFLSSLPADMRTTLGKVSSSSTENTEETKSPKSS